MTMQSKLLAFLFLIVLVSCQKKKQETLFELLGPSQTGVDFKNLLTETEENNILTYEYFYNGGGVAGGDFNNDGLIDLIFTGNMVENKIYLNKGNLKFEDISEKAKIGGRKDGWKTGVSLVDINADGWLDIYVCYSGNLSPEKRKNQLFINNKNLTFTEKAEEFGLADQGYSTQAAFLDFDKDGDLDCFIINHNLRNYEKNPDASIMRAKRDDYAGDKLFKNENGKFTEVTLQVGIKSNAIGFGLGVVVADVNLDGFPDIYVCNDYVEDDYLYINNKNGTFSDKSHEILDHTSHLAMGLDIADYNNDSLPDIFTLDMLPQENIRQKKLAFPDNWNVYQAQLKNGFNHQNMRNMLQVNNGDGTFSEIGQLAGISNTDWSWAGLLADFDNDGYKDFFLTNGEVKDYTDLDFIKYYDEEEESESKGKSKKALLEHLKNMPASKTHNYIFKNNGDLTFTNKVNDWGFEKLTVANGAIYADLDNDGDLEIITNNNNDVAHIYKNNSRETLKSHFIKVKLKGPTQNPLALGTKVWLYNGKNIQYQEFSPVRGFQSSMYDNLHFGISNEKEILKVKVEWPDGKIEIKNNIKIDQTIEFKHQNALELKNNPKINKTIFSSSDNIDFKHTENPANDFNFQIFLPYLYSNSGSRMAKGDVNGDHLEDLYLGGARNQAGKIFLQQKKGNFISYNQPDIVKDSSSEDQDAVFFDADGDKDLDLYVVSGEYNMSLNDKRQQDRLYINDGKGNFKRDAKAIPPEFINSKFVKAFDIENDGDIDLFIGGTVMPFAYPLASPSFILKNNGKGEFVLDKSVNLGILTDVEIIDLNKDGFLDLIIVGEWMTPKILINQKGNFTDQVTDKYFSTNLSGWWNRIIASDLDNDGDMDLVAGNIGNNTQMHISESNPLMLYFNDFEKNKTIDAFMTYYIQGKAYPNASRDEALEQMVSLRKKFTNYQSYSAAGIEDILTPEELKSAFKFYINFTETCIFENTGNSFIVKKLPIQAQFSPVHGISIDDFNRDGKKDILLAGNNSNYRLRIGKMDANHGVLLTGNGKLGFEYVPQQVSGLKIKGDVKDIKKVNDNTLVFFINNGKTLSYKIN